MTFAALVKVLAIAGSILVVLAAGLWSLMAPALAASDDDGGVSE